MSTNNKVLNSIFSDLPAAPYTMDISISQDLLLHVSVKNGSVYAEIKWEADHGFMALLDNWQGVPKNGQTYESLGREAVAYLFDSIEYHLIRQTERLVDPITIKKAETDLAAWKTEYQEMLAA